MSKRCPTPRKRAHATRKEAEEHVNGLYAKHGKAAAVWPYKCRCGAWHVGGRRKRTGRRGPIQR